MRVVATSRVQHRQHIRKTLGQHLMGERLISVDLAELGHSAAIPSLPRIVRPIAPTLSVAVVHDHVMAGASRQQ